MTAQLLSSELSTLLQESKRKNPDLRKHVERSIDILSGLPRTSEAQITADLRSRPDFVSPFIVACQTRNPKFAGNAVACLQRLIVSNALPKVALTDALDALKDVSSLATDIQLKVLQALPSLIQNYGTELRQHLLILAFQICFQLYGSKTSVVTNLAAAGIKQLVSSTFDKVASFRPLNDGNDQKVNDHNNSELKHHYRLDAYAVYKDICLLIDGSKAEFVEGAFLSQSFAFELVEAIVSDYIDLISQWPEGTWPLEKLVIPVITKILSGKAPFTATVRCLRLVDLILRTLLDQLPAECEGLLSLLNHLLDPEASTLWKRACCLEVLRNLHSENARVRKMYALYDAQDEKRNVIRDQLGALVRLASEKPAVIGLGQHSSIPIVTVDDSGEQAAIQAGGVVGIIGASADGPDINTPGISNQWSDIKVPLLEQMEKLEPSPLPATYIYKLALTCLTTFEEGLARFLLPFTVPKEKKSKRRAHKADDGGDTDGNVSVSEAQKEKKQTSPVNPINLREHPMYTEISIAAQMVDHCWPALLATSSTFFNASMDSENFHALIRAFQKFTQIAGLLELSTPRDAFLTALGKQALPASKVVKSPALPMLSNIDDTASLNDPSRDSSPAPKPQIKPPIKRQQTSQAGPVLNSRHLLCLRALLNLGIALGPSLHNAWSIILETLQQADLLIATTSGISRRPRSKDSQTNAEEDAEDDDLGLEITAAETAASRLFEGTREFDDPAFKGVMQSLRNLLQEETETGEPPTPAESMLSPTSAKPRHQKLRSFSGISNEADPTHHDSVFVLDKMRQIIRCNITRLSQVDTHESGWDLIYDCLLVALSTRANNRGIRVGAAVALNEMFVLCAVADTESSDDIDEIRARSLKGILNEVTRLYLPFAPQNKVTLQCDLDIHRSALDALRAILDQCGESLKIGWPEVFGIILSTFHDSPPSGPDHIEVIFRPRSLALVRASFGSIELICSDFLSSVPHSCLLQLLDTLHRFAFQNNDLNISLTTSTFFQLISDYVLRDQEETNLAGLQASRKASTKGLDSSGEISPNELWLALLDYLARLAADSRLEARHSAIHTVFRIIAASQLSQNSLDIIYDAVIGRILSRVDEMSRSDEQDFQTTHEWDRTTVLTVENVANVFVQWLDTFGTQSHTLKIVQMLLEQYEQTLHRQSYQVSKAVFGGTSRILSEVDEQHIDNSTVLHNAWQVWQRNSPISIDGASDLDNNDALLAHLFCLGQLLRLSGNDIQASNAEHVLDLLLQSVRGATSSAYSSDIDSMTAVQKAALESIKMLPRISNDFDIKTVILIKTLANLAYEPAADGKSGATTYVALSKSSMTLLESIVSKRKVDGFIDRKSTLPSIALSALQEPLRLKYQWSKPGRDPSPWKKATQTATCLITTFGPGLTPSPTQSAADSTLGFWATSVNTVIAVINANPPSPIPSTTTTSTPSSQISHDEDFDIQSFENLHPLLVSALESPTILSNERQKYCAALFHGSIIHSPHDEDLAQPNAPILAGLWIDHFGRVNHAPPNPRSRLAYLLLETLKGLCAPTSTKDGGAKPAGQVQNKKEGGNLLARTALPYLILRLALTLKAYIYDQPLRGRFPTPRSVKVELGFVLDIISACEIAGGKEVLLAGAAAVEEAEVWVGGQAKREMGFSNQAGREGGPQELCWGPGSLDIDGKSKAGRPLGRVAVNGRDDGDGEGQEGRGWMLKVLYPLLLRALRAARRDEEMERKIMGVLRGVV